MKLHYLTTLIALIALAAPAVHAAEKPAETAPATAQRHALRGVIVAIDAGKSALRIKHEEIPGVMRAMTMQFRVDAAALQAAQVGAAITGLMSRQPDHWLLENVKITAAK
jgi:Cu/Ag efflux protein CusF